VGDGRESELGGDFVELGPRPRIRIQNSDQTIGAKRVGILINFSIFFHLLKKKSLTQG
jgi:hypothetical protein